MPPLEYTTPGVDQVADDILRDNALAAERNAYIAEVEVQRLTALLDVAPKAKKAALERQIETQTSAAEDLRRKADRKAAYVALDPDDVTALRRRFLEDWVSGMEREHAAHVALLAERKASLALEGDLALTGAERKTVEGNAETNSEAIKVIESAHALAVQLQGELDTKDESA